MQERVVPFTADLLPGCAALFADTFNRPPWSDHWTAEAAAQRLRAIAATPGFAGFVLRRADGSIPAMVVGNREPWFDGEHFCIREMCVRAADQRQGRGTRLLRHLEAWFQEAGIDRVYLLTVRNGAAEAFYRRSGYAGNQCMRVMSRQIG